jgi:hypothetical protein
MKDDPALNCIFQKRAELVQIFHFGPFEFTLLEAMDGMDVCRYRVMMGLLEFEMVFVGVHSEVPCRTTSNVYLVHFAWHFLGQFVFQKHAMTLLPDPSSGAPRLLCLRYYRVASTGWTFGS